MRLEEEVEVEVDQAVVVEVGLVPAVNLAAATEAVQVLQALLGLTLARKRKQTPIHSHLIQNSNTPILLSKGIDLSFIKSFFLFCFFYITCFFSFLLCRYQAWTAIRWKQV